MKIESLHIAEFGSLNGVDLSFTDFVNVIEGDNESGKSTVAEFLRFIFYGFPDKKERLSHIGFSASSLSGSVVLLFENKRYRIERRATESRDTVKIFDCLTDEVCFPGEVPGQVFFGIPADLYLSTVYVGQLSGNRIDDQSTADAVANLLWNGDENVNVKKAVAIIEDARKELAHKRGDGGRINKLKAEIAQLQTSLSAASKTHMTIQALKNEREALFAKREKNLADDDILRGQLEDYRLMQYRVRKQKLRVYEEAWNQKETERLRFREDNTVRGFFPDDAYLDALIRCGNELTLHDGKVRDVDERLDRLNEEIRRSEEDKEKITSEEQRKRAVCVAKRGTVKSLAIICTLLFPCAALAAAWLLITAGPVGFMIAFSVLACAFLCGMITGYYFSSKYTALIRQLDGEAKEKGNLYLHRLEAIRVEREACLGERQKCRDRLDVLCNKWLGKTPAETLELARQVIDTDRENERLAEKCRYLYTGFKAQDEQAEEVSDDERIISLPDNFDPKETARRRDFVMGAAERMRASIEEHDIELAKLSSIDASPSLIQEKIMAKEYELARDVRRYEAYLCAIEALQSAEQTMRESVSPRLSENAGGYMAALTDGRYESLGVDRNFSVSFHPKTVSGDTVTKDAGYMSAGTSDAAYISLRLALSDLLCGEHRPPMIFDESFSRLDDRRLTAMLTLLVQSGRQVFILSSCDRERVCAEKADIASMGYINLSE